VAGVGDDRFLDDRLGAIVQKHCYEQERQMPYITSIERMGIEEGRKEGRKEGERSVILRQLTRRVGLVPEAMTDRIQQLTIEQLEALADALLDFTKLNDLVSWLEDDSQV
jgi:predicted transposase YdaD